MKYFISLKTLYSFLGALMLVCGIRGGLSLFHIIEMTLAESAANFIMLVSAWLGRGFIRKHEGREAR